MPRARKSGAQRVVDAPVHHLGPTLSGPVWHLAVGRQQRRSTDGRGRKRTGEKRRKKGEGESGTQEAPETGCGQLFTSWRMIYLGVARLRNLDTWIFGARRRHRRRHRRRREKGSIEISVRYRNFHVVSLLFILDFISAGFKTDTCISNSVSGFPLDKYRKILILSSISFFHFISFLIYILFICLRVSK